ncbi:hypothetical protein OHR68_35315 [Spirillospora sp. NBC_00431]
MPAEPPLSSWATNRFGERAGLVRRTVAESVLRAIRNAQDAQEDSQTDRAYPFGWALHPRKFEALHEGFKDQPGFNSVRPHGSIHQMTVVSGNLLFPFCFAKDRSINVMKAKITEDKVSGLLKVLFALFGPERTIEQLTLDSEDEEESKRLIAVADSLSRLPEDTELVLVPYACNFKAGLLELWWGDAELLDDRGHLEWHHCEEIPVPDTPPPGRRRLQSVGEPPSPNAGPRFDQGPVPLPPLTPRSPVELSDSEKFPPRSEKADSPDQDVTDREES